MHIKDNNLQRHPPTHTHTHTLNLCFHIKNIKTTVRQQISVQGSKVVWK